MMRRLLLLSLLLPAGFACDSLSPLPLADLRGPVAVTTVASGRPEGTLVFIANADDEELRVFEPETGLFVRGPNAISPLSILLGFRPQRLAGGALEGADGPLGFVLAVGGADRVALVDAQQLRVREDEAERARCDQGDASALCLPGPALDVAVRGDAAWVVVEGTPASSPQLAVLSVVEVDGVPFVRLTDLLPLPGEPVAVALHPDGSRAWVADASAPRILEVALPGGGVTELDVDEPARRLVSTPAYVREDGGSEPAGRYVLAFLRDGRLQTIDPLFGGPARDPLDASRAIAPLSFATPIRDLTFIPCPPPDQGPCRTRLRAGGRVHELPLLAFASLGDGTVAAVVPDADDPQVFRPFEPDPGDVRAGTPVLQEPERVAGAPASEVQLSVDTGSLTRGVTLSETIRVTHNGIIPGFSVRPGRLEDDGGTVVLVDPRGGLDAPDRARVGDRVSVTGLDAPCPALLQPVRFEVTDVSDDQLSLTALGGALSATCLPSRVTYELEAAADAPWVVVGSASGYAGRAQADVPFTIPGRRFAYLPDSTDGPAVTFTITGADPTPRAEFAFTTTSGVAPLILSFPVGDRVAMPSALANGVTATPTRLYTVVVGTQALTEVLLDSIGQANAVRVYNRALSRR